MDETKNKDNLAKFIDYRVEMKVEDAILDHKDEIRRSLAEQREDNYMQIEHHFKEFHTKYNHGRGFLGGAAGLHGGFPGAYGGYGGHHFYNSAYHAFADPDQFEPTKDFKDDWVLKNGTLYRKQ